jgi:hypothetical protein
MTSNAHRTTLLEVLEKYRKAVSYAACVGIEYSPRLAKSALTGELRPVQ